MKSDDSCVCWLVVLAACVFVSGAVGDSPLSAAQSKPPASGAVAPAGKPRKAASRAPRVQDYQVAAGSAVSIELRTRLSSHGSQRADAIEGRLLRAADLRATASSWCPAGRERPGDGERGRASGRQAPGRLAFTVPDHRAPRDGKPRHHQDREVLTFESQLPVKGICSRDVRIEKGADASVAPARAAPGGIPVEDCRPSYSTVPSD